MNPGGGEVQFSKTSEYLKRRGIEVRPIDSLPSSWRGCDLLHIFGTTREGLEVARGAKSHGVPVALSTISWYDPWVSWRLEPTGWRRVRSVAGWGVRRLVPSVSSWRRELLHLCDLLLPNSQAEARQLQQLFAVPARKIAVVPNGVDERFAHGDAGLFERHFGLRDFVLVPGRIEPRKNQLNVLRSLWGSGLSVVVLGDPHPNHRGYADECRRESDVGVTFVGRLEHGSPLLAAANAAARVIVLASWFETPGLAALEGALAGTQIVVTERGCTREYFEDLVRYVSPDDTRGIRHAVREAFKAPRSRALSDLIRTNFLWDHTAHATLTAYRELFGRPHHGANLFPMAAAA
jgi:glycosyltransferase involved in cell wall biosynthesis